MSEIAENLGGQLVFGRNGRIWRISSVRHDWWVAMVTSFLLPGVQPGHDHDGDDGDDDHDGECTSGSDDNDDDIVPSWAS